MGYKPFDLTGKVALVTGGNGGIGLGMAQALADAGADIAIWGTNADKNCAAEAALKASGRRVLAQTVDVANELQVVEGMKTVIDKLGRVDTVIANAGIGIGSRSFLDITIEQFRKVVSVNQEGAFLTLREAARHMRDRASKGDAGGSLAVVASLAAIEGAARNQHYAATKGAVVSMMRAIAVEFGRDGVRANAILPGWIATDMTAMAQTSSNFTDKVISRVPSRRWGQPADFGGIAVYLASDASAYHSGDTFVIDGGYAVF
ncbi:MAG: SDR family oxidoreductase [Alphaproteobacteria bacterium]|nr:SDR family oxidoreductase [Alphaproteobacteria bacterium]